MKLTAGLGAAFFITSMALAVVANNKASEDGLIGLPQVPSTVDDSAPGTPKTVD